ncbi:MAG: NTP transferase domain-containing protein [Saprospiraceae bacterium]|nr:NTP transferase domain-containing protein [Candidatus Brachybacter algidus]
MVPKDKLVGVVISGGKSSRMGTDKSLLLWNNKPFYLHTAEILHSFLQ